MRAIATAAAAGLLAGCSSTVMLEPALELSPYYATYQLRGDVALQNDPGGGAPVHDNLPRQLSEFGQEHHEDDVGIRATWGDRFGGLRADYYRLDMSSMSPGVIPFHWGELLPDDLVRMDIVMDELRLSYVEPLWQHETSLRDEDLMLRFAAGGEYAYRDMAMDAQTDDGLRRQRVQIHGETISLAARLRAEWLDLTLDLEYAICPDLVLGGDLRDVNHDIEARLSYAVPLRDVSFFAGYRYSSFDARGNAGILDYDATLELDGLQFGMTVTL